MQSPILCCMTQRQFHRFYKRHLSRVYKFIYFRVGGNVQVAEDLTSEVFMKAVEHMEKLDVEQEPLAWVMTVAKNRLKNHYRDKRQHLDIDDLSGFLPGEDGRNTFQGIVAAEEIKKRLQVLKPKARHVVELKYLEGFSFKEIALLLEMTPGAARVQCHRAMKQLQAQTT